MLGLSCWVDFSLVAANGGHSPLGAHRLLIAVASPVAEHRLQETQASAVAAPGLHSTGLEVVPHRLSCSTPCGIFRTRDPTCISCTGRRILYHWATRKALRTMFSKGRHCRRKDAWSRGAGRIMTDGARPRLDAGWWNTTGSIAQPGRENGTTNVRFKNLICKNKYCFAYWIKTKEKWVLSVTTMEYNQIVQNAILEIWYHFLKWKYIYVIFPIYCKPSFLVEWGKILKL